MFSFEGFQDKSAYAKFGGCPTVVSKKKGGTNRHTATERALHLYIHLVDNYNYGSNRLPLSFVV